MDQAQLQAEYEKIVAQINTDGLSRPGSELALRTEELIAKAEALVAAGAENRHELRILLAKSSSPGWIMKMTEDEDGNDC